MKANTVTVSYVINYTSYCNPCDPPRMKMLSCRFADVENAKDYAEHLSTCEDVDDGVVDVVSNITGEVFYVYKHGEIYYNGYDREEG